MSDKLTITDLDGSVTEIELDIDEKIEAIVAYRLRQRTRELNAAERRVQELEAQLLGFEMAQETLVIDLRRIAERIGNPQDEWYGFGPIVENIHTGITKLESQLAAQWRPVTEQEPPQGKKVLGKQYIESSPCIVSLEFDPMENDFVWQDVDGVSYFYDSINYWRSIE